MTVRVLLCDDHAMVREGLERLLNSREGIEVVGTAADGDEAVAVAAELHPDVVMMDFSMPRLDGIEATRRIVAATPGTRIVMLTSFREDARVLDALSAGGVGVILEEAGGGAAGRGSQAGPMGGGALGP